MRGPCRPRRVPWAAGRCPRLPAPRASPLPTPRACASARSQGAAAARVCAPQQLPHLDPDARFLYCGCVVASHAPEHTRNGRDFIGRNLNVCRLKIRIQIGLKHFCKAGYMLCILNPNNISRLINNYIFFFKDRLTQIILTIGILYSTPLKTIIWIPP